MKSAHEIPLLRDAMAIKADMRHRIRLFNEWLQAEGPPWYGADLVSFGEYLAKTKGLTAATVLAHVSTIKARYRDLALSGRLDELLEDALPDVEAREANRQAALKAIQAAATLDTRYLGVERVPDITYLTMAQINALLLKPDVTTVSGLRDVAIIGLLFCTGINETELCRLTMGDIDPINDFSDWTIYVPGAVTGEGRAVTVYDHVLFDQRWLARYFKALRRETDVRSGPVFRGLRRDARTVRPKGLMARAVREILKSYAVNLTPNSTVTFTALDLRRTFARRLFLAGVDFDAIQANLGHGSTATREYIGPPAVRGFSEPRHRGNAGRLLQRLDKR